MGQIINLLASVCQCVCERSYGHNFYLIFGEILHSVSGPKSKIAQFLIFTPIMPFQWECSNTTAKRPDDLQ